MDEHMAAQLRARGASGRGHVSRSVTSDQIAEADLVLTFEYAQLLRLIEQWPRHAHKIFMLHQFADAVRHVPPLVSSEEMLSAARTLALPDSMSFDISDPHGRGRRAARRCADEIDLLLGPVVQALAGRSASPDRGSD